MDKEQTIMQPLYSRRAQYRHHQASFGVYSRAAQPGALDGGLEVIRPQKTNTDTPVGRTQSIGDSAKTGHRASGSIESAEDLGLDAPNASTEGVKRQGKF